MSSIASGTTSTTALVYTADTSGVLQLQTNGTTTAVTINTSQQVGIGTASPSTLLHVNGLITLSGNNYVSNPTNATIGQYTYGGANYNYTQIPSGGYWQVWLPNTNAALTVDTNGNLGLGVTPSSWGSGRRAIQLFGSSTATYFAGSAVNTIFSTNYFVNSTPADAFIANGYASFYQQNYQGAHQWFTSSVSNSSGAGATATMNQLMTLSNIGNLNITSNAVTSVISAKSGASGDVSQEAVQFIKYDNNTSVSQIFAKFFINQGGAANGQINANGANQAAFGNTSDITLKTNITPLASQLANINSIEVIEFDYIESEGGGHQIGFSAQNMQTIYPDTVGTRADGKLTLTGWNKTEARLVKAIQELSAQVTTLQSQVAALTPKA